MKMKIIDYLKLYSPLTLGSFDEAMDERVNTLIEKGTLLGVSVDHSGNSDLVVFSLDGKLYSVWIANKFYAYGGAVELAHGRYWKFDSSKRPSRKTMKKLFLMTESFAKENGVNFDKYCEIVDKNRGFVQESASFLRVMDQGV